MVPGILKFSIAGRDFRFKFGDITKRQRGLKNEEHPRPFGSTLINGSFWDGSQLNHKGFFGIWGFQGWKAGQDPAVSSRTTSHVWRSPGSQRGRAHGQAWSLIGFNSPRIKNDAHQARKERLQLSFCLVKQSQSRVESPKITHGQCASAMVCKQLTNSHSLVQNLLTDFFFFFWSTKRSRTHTINYSLQMIHQLQKLPNPWAPFPNSGWISQDWF